METLCLSETEASGESFSFGEELVVLFFMLLADESRRPSNGLHQPPNSFLIRTSWTDIQHPSNRGVGFQTPY
jgi:hypothetical protein